MMKSVVESSIVLEWTVAKSNPKSMRSNNSPLSTILHELALAQQIRINEWFELAIKNAAGI